MMKKKIPKYPLKLNNNIYITNDYKQVLLNNNKKKNL